MNVDKEVNYYNPSDFQKFDQLNSFPEYNNYVDKINSGDTTNPWLDYILNRCDYINEQVK